MTVDNALELYWLDDGREETLTAAAPSRLLLDSRTIRHHPKRFRAGDRQE